MTNDTTAERLAKAAEACAWLIREKFSFGVKTYVTRHENDAKMHYERGNEVIALYEMNEPSGVSGQLVDAVQALVTAYEAMPDGVLGRGLTNGDFLRLSEALAAYRASGEQEDDWTPEDELLSRACGAACKASTLKNPIFDHASMRAALRVLRAELQAALPASPTAGLTEADGPWKEAVINELIVSHILTSEHENDPRKAVQDAISWNCMVALDPAVSSDAQALIERGKKEAGLTERRENGGRGPDARFTTTVADWMNLASPAPSPCRETEVTDAMVARAYEICDNFVDEHGEGDSSKLNDGQWEAMLRKIIGSIIGASGTMALIGYAGEDNVDRMLDGEVGGCHIGDKAPGRTRPVYAAPRARPGQESSHD